jgi:hypothetical protein
MPKNLTDSIKVAGELVHVRRRRVSQT